MVIVVPKGALTRQQKKELKLANYIIIDCIEPEKIKIINPEQPIETNDLMLSALSALKSDHPTSKQEKFVNELYNRLSNDKKQ